MVKRSGATSRGTVLLLSVYACALSIGQNFLLIVETSLKATEISLNSPLWDTEYGTEPFKSLLSSSLVEPEEFGLGLFGDTQPSTCRHR